MKKEFERELMAQKGTLSDQYLITIKLAAKVCNTVHEEKLKGILESIMILSGNDEVDKIIYKIAKEENL